MAGHTRFIDNFLTNATNDGFAALYPNGPYDHRCTYTNWLDYLADNNATSAILARFQNLWTETANEYELESLIILNDTFTEASPPVALASHTSDSGATWAIASSNQGGSINVVAGGLLNKSDTAAQNTLYDASVIVPVAAQQKMRARMVAVSSAQGRGGFGVVIRRNKTSNNNYLLDLFQAVAATPSAQLRLYRYTNGVYAIIQSAVVALPGVTGEVSIELRIDGNNMAAYYNDAEVFTAVDVNFPTGDTVGILKAFAQDGVANGYNPTSVLFERIP